MLEELFKRLGVATGRLVDLGCGGYGNSNTRWLLENGWQGELYDGEPQPPPAKQAWITARTVAHLVPDDAPVDLLCIDLDGNDWWIWREIQASIPVVLVEINSNLDPTVPLVMPYNPAHRWAEDTYYGASFAAWLWLAKEKGYVPACCVEDQNLFLVRGDLAAACDIECKQRVVHPPHPAGKTWLKLVSRY